MARRGNFSIAICDDDQQYVHHLRDMIKEMERDGSRLLVHFFFSGRDLLQKEVEKYDLLILDMVFPQENGRKIAEEFRKRNKKGMIVYCSGKKSPIPDDFRMGVYRFMRKERVTQLKRDLQDTIDELYRREAKEKICLTAGKRNTLINIEDIIYIEIIKTGSRVHYYDERGKICALEVKEKLKEIYPRVAPFGFVYAHNSYFVNCYKIKHWTTKDVILQDGTCLAISRSKEKEFNAACVRLIAY
ncbi:MAG: LytTR family transcriptional regulator DNA-binding domain-containing protein [Lachnospiraceae bacterium]|nr:LytTR family transcriptional regulator DNA-binding domain-containing protein [Lachnospiraceae bacterium]